LARWRRSRPRLARWVAALALAAPIVVPDDALLAVPFGVLLTSPPPAGPIELAAYPKLAWLARRHAVTVLPSATALRALRQTPRARAANVEMFVGFGDPVLAGFGGQRGGPMVSTRRAGVDAIRSLSALPGTRDELLAIARALGAEPSHAVFLGPRATKPQLMALDATGRLARTRVLSFATHGLLAGEIGVHQPALVLTPPAEASEQDDGLLSLDDIVQLRLGSADWVVLSACNTGAADGSGESLSGLARAFFFAGAPTLLVSHWSVDDAATSALMTRIFERYARHPKIARAEALRQATLALMAQAQGPTAHFAHPFAWAPFFLVGEGQ
jgi:CHAT domain-containing protein